MPSDSMVGVALSRNCDTRMEKRNLHFMFIMRISTGVENMGGFKIWLGAEVNRWGEHGGLKMLSKNTCEGIHLIVKLLAISLQACKFTENELLHTYFSRILAEFVMVHSILKLGENLELKGFEKF